MACRGIRGATTVGSNTKEEILSATRQLLGLMIRLNDIQPEDVASALFTVTHDLDAEFPAHAARQLGWLEVPLMCSYEIHVPGSLQRCIRVMIHWNTAKSQKEISHPYLREAKRLRPDLTTPPRIDFEELDRWIEDYIQTHET